MIKGTHNSLTGYPLVYAQKFFKWFINPFSKCQNKDIREQFDNGVRLFDLQVSYKDNLFIGSHGLAWYDTRSIVPILDMLNAYAEHYNTTVYIMLGYDYHIPAYKTYMDKFNFLLLQLIGGEYPNLKLVRAYVENPWEILYEDKEFTSKIYEKYWSLSWAKSMKKHWWQFYYYLPIPWIWKKIYGKQWEREAKESGKEFYITDFV